MDVRNDSTAGDEGLEHGFATVLPLTESAGPTAELKGIYVGVRSRPTTDLSESVSNRIIANTLENIIECPASPIAAGLREDSNRSATSTQGAKRVFDFSYDKVFNHLASQEDVMTAVGDHAVERVLSGFNGTVLCYGQSGSGKTHTMIGSGGGSLANFHNNPETGEWNWSDEVGLLPRMLYFLFQQLVERHGPCTQEASEYKTEEERRAHAPWTVELSALELYNEDLRDLIPGDIRPTGPSSRFSRLSSLVPAETFSEQEHEPGPRMPALKATKSPAAGEGGGSSSISTRRASSTKAFNLSTSPATEGGVALRIRQSTPRESLGTSVWVEGLRRHPVNDFGEAMAGIQQALHERKIGGTRLNARSNRSHTLFLVCVCQREKASLAEAPPIGSSAEEVLQVKQSVLTLVDLAGSERVSQTGAEGLQLLEAQRINLSLTLLGNVIRRLTTGGVKQGGHIPYRDSKLTRLLQDSFGGNAVTFLLCNIAPEERNRSETLSTLRFAQLAKRVKNKVTVNTSISTGSIEEQLKQAFDYIAWLENKLKAATGNRGAATSTASYMSTEDQNTISSHTALVHSTPHEYVTDELSRLTKEKNLIKSPKTRSSQSALEMELSTEKDTKTNIQNDTPHSNLDSSAESLVPRAQQHRPEKCVPAAFLYTPPPQTPETESGLLSELSDVHEAHSSPLHENLPRSSPARHSLLLSCSQTKPANAMPPPVMPQPRSLTTVELSPTEADDIAEFTLDHPDEDVASVRSVDQHSMLSKRGLAGTEAPSFAPVIFTPVLGLRPSEVESGAPLQSPDRNHQRAEPDPRAIPVEVPPFELLEDTQQFLQSYGYCTPMSAAAETYQQLHPLSTSSAARLAMQTVEDTEDWSEPDIEEFKAPQEVQRQQKKRSALQRMMDAMKLAAAITKSTEESHF